jgi:hypothetical protein
MRKLFLLPILALLVSASTPVRVKPTMNDVGPPPNCMPCTCDLIDGHWVCSS